MNSVDEKPGALLDQALESLGRRLDHSDAATGGPRQDV